MDDILQYFFRSSKSSVYNIPGISVSIAWDSPEQWLQAELPRPMVFFLMNYSKFQWKKIVPIYRLSLIARVMGLSVLSLKLIAQHLSIEWEESFFILSRIFFDRWTLHAPPPVILTITHVPALISFFMCIVGFCELSEHSFLFV